MSNYKLTKIRESLTRAINDLEIMKVDKEDSDYPLKDELDKAINHLYLTHGLIRLISGLSKGETGEVYRDDFESRV